MNEKRFVLSGAGGSGLSRTFRGRSAMPEPRQRTIVCFWKRSSGGCAPGRLDAIYRLPLAI